MSRRARLAAAVATFGAGLWVGQCVRALAATADVDSARLGFEMMGIEIAVGATAIAVALALPGALRDRLGLRRGRLPLSGAIALVIGVLGTSHAIDAALHGTRALDHSVVRGISEGLEAAWGAGFVVAFFGTVVAPSIAEELLCRGLVQRSAAARIGPFGAVVISSLVFGWIHMELVHGAIAAAIGCYLGIAAYWSDSTRVAMAGHAANNGAALLGSAGIVHLGGPPDIALPVGIAIAALGLLWAWRVRPRGVAGEVPAESPLQPQRHSTDA